MPKKGKRVKPQDELKHLVCARVPAELCNNLVSVLAYMPGTTMSRFLRQILVGRRPIKIFTRDMSMDPVAIEICAIRQKIRSKGQKVNQFTRLFNAAKNDTERAFFAKMVFLSAASIEPDISRLLELVEMLKQVYLVDGKWNRFPSETRVVENIYELATELAAAADQQHIGSCWIDGLGASQPG